MEGQRTRAASEQLPARPFSLRPRRRRQRRAGQARRVRRIRRRQGRQQRVWERRRPRGRQQRMVWEQAEDGPSVSAAPTTTAPARWRPTTATTATASTAAAPGWRSTPAADRRATTASADRPTLGGVPTRGEGRPTEAAARRNGRRPADDDVHRHGVDACGYRSTRTETYQVQGMKEGPACAGPSLWKLGRYGFRPLPLPGLAFPGLPFPPALSLGW